MLLNMDQDEDQLFREIDQDIQEDIPFVIDQLRNFHSDQVADNDISKSIDQVINNLDNLRNQLVILRAFTIAAKRIIS